MNISEWKEKLSCGRYDEKLKALYGAEGLKKGKARISKALDEFSDVFPLRKNEDISVFSAPGRTEIGGNHTDHQKGRVLAAAVHLDILGSVCFHSEPFIRIKSEGYPLETADLKDLYVREEERETTAALVRGIAAGFSKNGFKTGGFDAYIVSDVPGGSGLSSSAAFEVLIGTILNSGYNNNSVSAVEIAKIGQYAENVYFGKKSGLMDQAASSIGGLVFMDFKDSENPVIKTHDFDFSDYGYTICITDTKASHSGLSSEYTCVALEMSSAAAQFGKECLREVNEAEFYEKLPEIRKNCSDRSILRAIHFFGENRRAAEQSRALENKDISRFLELANASGASSAELLQNLYSIKNPDEQSIPLALAVSEHVLRGKYALRVHGGGFAGTIQAIIPLELKEEYKKEMEKLFDKGCCCELKIRPFGGVEIF